MKNIILGIVISLTAVAALADDGATGLTNSGNRELLNDVKSVAWKCGVKLVKALDQNDIIGYKSNCAELVLHGDSKAQVFVDGQWYTAKITASPQADEGDLDNMQLFDDSGKLVAVRTNVLAFDSIVLALAGGESYVQSEPAPGESAQPEMQTEIIP